MAIDPIIPSMQLQYSVSFEDFKTLQPPFEVKAGKNAGYKGVLVACGLIAALGVFCLAKNFGWQVGAFLIGLGGIAAAAAYFYEKRSAQKVEEQHNQKLTTAYQHIHCRDERFFEADENGFTMKCKCGALTRPWSELTGFSETKNHVALGTKSGWQIIPKSAFASPAVLTEFRASLSEKVNHGKQVTARHVDFMCTREDLRHAQWVHLVRAGGWRSLAKAFATFTCAAYGAFVIGKAAHNTAITAGLIGGLLAIPLLKSAGKRRKIKFLPLRIYFDDQGLFLQDPMTQARAPWSQFAGYLENKQLLLLYGNPRKYRIIPKRALLGQGAELEKVIKSKLPPFNYRQPHLHAHMRSVGATPQTP